MNDKAIIDKEQNEELSPETERLLNRIHDTFHRVIELNEQFDEHEFNRIEKLTKAEITTLSLLYNNPQMIMRDMSDKLKVSKSTMTGIIDDLEKYGFVQRVINKKDRRSYALEVTEEGRLAQKEHLDWERSFYLYFLNAMQACDVPETFLDYMEKMLEYLGF